MIFLPEATLKAVNKLMLQLDNEEGDPAEILQRILDLDPHEHAVLTVLARILFKSDPKKAEELLWRAIEAQPCVYPAYLQLSEMLSDQEALSKGLTELACRKILWDEEAMDNVEREKPDFDLAGLPDFEKLKPADRLKAISLWLIDQRDLEPAAVTALLRPHRLLQQMQDVETLDRSLVDAIVQEGASMVPLLIGVLRGWVRNVIPEDDFSLVENSIALLGEIGDPSAIPYLVPMVPVEDPAISGACHWALDRIVQKNPQAAARVMGDIAAGLDGAERIAIAEIMIHRPEIDPKAALLERLFENLEQVDKEVREPCFKALISTGVALRGREGVELARGFLRRYGSALSRSARRDCDEAIEELAEMVDTMPPPQPPEPSPWTVYQICAGQVDWDEELERSEEDEDDYPQPVSRKATPGRNDPCWCGSGKKYKKCHLPADEGNDRKAAGAERATSRQDLDPFDPLRRNVGALLKTLPPEENKSAMAEFFEPGESTDEMAFAMFVDWMVHDRVSQTLGRTVMEEYLARHDSQLNKQERGFLETSAASYVDLYEIQEIKEGTGAEVKSLTSGETFFVHDVALSKALVRWDGVHARVIHGTRGLEFSGTAVQIPRMHLSTLRSWMEEDKQRKLSWPVYLKRNWPRIRQQGKKIGEEWMDSLKMQNTDAEEMVLSKAVFEVINHGAVIASLRSAVEIDEAEESTAFVWLSGRAAEKGNTVLGNIRISDGELTLECNSKERLKRGKKLLTELAGPALSFRKDEFTTQKELMKGIRERPAEKEESRVPPEIERQVVGEYMERHYAQWPDVKLPALDGKTPRQAIRNAAGKRKVAELLKQFENSEARKKKAGEYYYDISRLRAELGIKA